MPGHNDGNNETQNSVHSIGWSIKTNSAPFFYRQNFSIVNT